MRIAPALLALMLTSGCAPSLHGMSVGELAAVSDSVLCTTVANDLAQGAGSERVESERERRGLNCQAYIDEIVEDCSALTLENSNPPTRYHPGPNGEAAYMVTLSIVNSKSKPMDFSILWKGRQVGFYTIGAGERRSYSFISGLGNHDQMGRPLTVTGASLRFCRVMRGFGG